MTACTKIIVYDLPEETRNRLGGVAEVTLETAPGFSIRQSKDVEQLNEDGKILLEGAERFSVPSTRVNDAVLTKFYTPLTLDNRQTYMKCRVYVGNSEILLTRLYVIERGAASWELELRRPADHWAELGQAMKINEIDFGTFELTAASLEANWAVPTYAGDFTPEGDTPTYWPLVDYGGWIDQVQPDQLTFRPLKAILPEDFRPWINLVYLLKRGACQIGWNLEGVIFETEYWRSLWVYILHSEYWKAADSPQISFVSVSDQYDIPEFHLSIIADGLDLSDPDMLLSVGGGFYFAGCANKINGDAFYCFRLIGRLRNNAAEEINVVFDIGEIDPPNALLSGDVLSEEYVVTLGASDEKDVVVEFSNVLLKRGQKACMFVRTQDAAVDPTLLAGFRFTVTPCNKSFVHDSVVRVSEAVRDDQTWLDWFKVFLGLCNGRTTTDWITRTITVHPQGRKDVYGEIVPSFLRDENVAADISRLVIPESIRARPIRPELKRYTRYQFADSTDAYIESLNLTEPAHSRKLINGADLPDGIEEVQVQILEPTLEGQAVGLRTPKSIESPDKAAPSPYLPRLWDNRNDDGSTARSFDIAPRIAFGFGLIRQINPEPAVQTTAEIYAGFYFDGQAGGNVRYYFGYASQLRTWDIDPEPVIDGSAVFGSVDRDLFVTYFLDSVQSRKYGTALDVLLVMRPDDYSRFDFRDLFGFNFLGRPLRVKMTAIRDFASCDGSVPTPVTFLADPAETACCDLPCSCRFMTCEFYQDLGPYLRQATLDGLTITSFTVDDVQYIDTPVGLGSLEFIEIASLPHVTNLWKTLNALGVPYFTFEQSTRTHPERGARFFKIKWPACQGFVIELSFGGDVVYRYTDESQQTAWFGGVWSDLGYGSAYYSEPIECVTTVEY